MELVVASDSSLLIVFGNEISPDLHRHVIALFHALQAQKEFRIRNLHPAYASVLIDFDPTRMSHEELASLVYRLSGSAHSKDEVAGNTVNIPVCYGGEFGPDLADVAAHTKMSVEDVIRLHCSARYLVYFLGFSPGFAYLGGMPEQLATPRLATPRKRVVAGSVGIAGSQTGVYPMDSPGGWRVIGRTPLRMFDPEATPASRLQPGDVVKFYSIDRATLDDMARTH